MRLGPHYDRKDIKRVKSQENMQHSTEQKHQVHEFHNLGCEGSHQVVIYEIPPLR